MKILVLSDSHSSRAFMRYCIDQIKPAHIIHLGDLYEDGEVIAEEYPHIRVHQVPGNCDSFGGISEAPSVLCYCIGGVKLYMTHGHLHGVKSGLDRLLFAARREEAQMVLYGHTHQMDCHREADGLYVLNPGSCRGYGGSAGLVEVDNGAVLSCCLVTQEDFSLTDSQ